MTKNADSAKFQKQGITFFPSHDIEFLKSMKLSYRIPFIWICLIFFSASFLSFFLILTFSVAWKLGLEAWLDSHWHMSL